MNKVTSVKNAKELMNRYSTRTKKRLGQNFLIDGNVTEKIVASLSLARTDTVIEIGPGLGALSQVIAPRCKRLILIEIDPDMAAIVEEVTKEFDNVEIIVCDALKIDISSLIVEDEGVKIISNVPYYITTPLIEHFLKFKQSIKTIVIMVQKEVAQRICAKNACKEYSSFSVFCAYNAHCEYLFDVSRNVFLPSPNVDSAVIRLTPIKRDISLEEEEFFFKVLRASFSSRRKTLANSLGNNLGIEKSRIFDGAKELGYEADVRAERLSLEDFMRLCHILRENVK